MEQEPQSHRIALVMTKWIGSPQSILIHTAVFVASFAITLIGWFPFDRMLLILTTVLSLEAIYLALFIQMTVNYTSTAVKEVSDDIGDIQVDVGEIQEDIEEISEDVGEITEDVDEIQKDVDELQENVEEISEDVGEISEDVGEINEDDAAHELHTTYQQQTLATIQADLRKLMEDIERLKSAR